MRARLSLLYFFQFSIWGCYLTCFGQFLGASGLGGDIAWFYAAIGFVSIVTPPLLGRLADRTGRPEILLGLCHLFAAIVMIVMWRYGMMHPVMEFRFFYPLYLLFLALYMPTMALANTVAFALLARNGLSTVTSFPTVRIWGTIGFVAAMWFVNSAYWYDGRFGFSLSDIGETGHYRFQYNAMMLLCSAVMGFLTSAYSFSLPTQSRSVRSHKGIEAGLQRNEEKILLGESIKIMFGVKEISVFLLFVVFSGVCLQISNGFATPYITHFSGVPDYANSLVSGNATMLFSLSQLSEAACVLLVGISLKWRGIRWVYAIGLLAWALRFLMLGWGNPDDGLWLLVGSMLVYGVAFNFITIGGHLYIQQVAPSHMKGFAQGLMMFMSNGIGATLGIIAAGAIVNHWCSWQMVTLSGAETPVRLFMGEWEWPWLIFGLYALAIFTAWSLCSRRMKK